jgi:hypothetical protein
MRLRTATFVAAALIVTGSEWVLWQALRDATNGLHHMARVYADHRCADVTVTAELHRVPSSPSFELTEHYEYVAGAPLVQPPPMADPVIAKSPITLGRGTRV